MYRSKKQLKELKVGTFFYLNNQKYLIVSSYVEHFAGVFSFYYNTHQNLDMETMVLPVPMEVIDHDRYKILLSKEKELDDIKKEKLNNILIEK